MLRFARFASVLLLKEMPMGQRLLIVLAALSLTAAGCKESSKVFACEREISCDELYGFNRKEAEFRCSKSDSLSEGTCPKENLLGRCRKETFTAGDPPFVLEVESYYSPLPEGVTVKRLRSDCGLKPEWEWLRPGASLAIPQDLRPK